VYTVGYLQVLTWSGNNTERIPGPWSSLFVE